MLLGYVIYNGRTIEIRGVSEPFIRGKNYLSNGDIGYPDEGGEYYIENIIENGIDVTEQFDDEDFENILNILSHVENRFLRRREKTNHAQPSKTSGAGLGCRSSRF